MYWLYNKFSCHVHEEWKLIITNHFLGAQYIYGNDQLGHPLFGPFCSHTIKQASSADTDSLINHSNTCLSY